MAESDEEAKSSNNTRKRSLQPDISTKELSLTVNIEKEPRRSSSRIKNVQSPDSSDESSEGNNGIISQSNRRPARKGRFIKGTSLLAALKETRKRNDRSLLKRKSPQKSVKGKTMEPNQFTILSSVPDVGMCSLLEEVSAVHSLSQSSDNTSNVNRETISYKPNDTNKLSDEDSDVLSPEISIQSIEAIKPPSFTDFSKRSLVIDNLDPHLTKAPILWALDNMKLDTEDETDWTSTANCIWSKWKCLPLEVQTHYVELAQSKTTHLYKEHNAPIVSQNHNPPISTVNSSTAYSQSFSYSPSIVVTTPSYVATHSTFLNKEQYIPAVNLSSSFGGHYTCTIPSSSSSSLSTKPLLSKSNTSVATATSIKKNTSKGQKKAKSTKAASKSPLSNVIIPRSTKSPTKSSTKTSKNFLYVSDEWKNTLKAKVNEMMKRKNGEELESLPSKSPPPKKKAIHGCSNKLTRPPMMKATSPATLQSIQYQPNDITIQSSPSVSSPQANIKSPLSVPSNLMQEMGNSFALTDAINYAELERQYRYAQSMLEHQQLYVESLKSRLIQARIQQQILLLNSEHYQLCSKKVVLPYWEPDIPVSIKGYKTSNYKSKFTWKGSFDKPSVEGNDYYKSLLDTLL